MSSETIDRFRLQPGDSFRAKWNRAEITVERTLGEGANGSVYLVRSSFGPSRYALKIGTDSFGLQSEINALRAVGESLSHDPSIRSQVPKLLLADDGSIQGRTFPFYLMTYFPGSVLSKTDVSPILLTCGSNVLQVLMGFHRSGWTFGDLKSENIMVSPKGRTQLVDCGGATRFGHAVKQFTELYDRGFWKAGGRKADAAYDLFAFAVVMLEAAGNGKRLRIAAASARHRNPKTLSALLDETPGLKPVAPIVRKMIYTEYRSSDAAYQAWRDAVNGLRKAGEGDGHPWVSIWFAAALLSFFVAVWLVR